jgi:hypothetical protein
MLKTSAFTSKRQQRFFFANADKPGSGITMEMAKEWADKTDFSKLPEKKKPDKKKKKTAEFTLRSQLANLASF